MSISVDAAVNAQRSSYGFRYWISSHAVDRFRERLGEDNKARVDWEVARVLDERLKSAKLAIVRDTDAPDVDTTIAAIESRNGNKCYVVLRPHNPLEPRVRIIGGPTGQPGLCAITVLTSEMATNNYSRGQWKVVNRVLADKLTASGVVVANAEQSKDLTRRASMPANFGTPPSSKTEQVIPTVTEPKKSSGPKRGGTAAERYEFAKRVLRERPNIRTAGADGLIELVRAEFGTGMADRTITAIRAQVAAESQGAAPPTAPSTARRTVKAAVVPSNSFAADLTAAVEAERLAKLAFATAMDAYQAAERTLHEASARVEAAVQNLQAQRLAQ